MTAVRPCNLCDELAACSRGEGLSFAEDALSIGLPSLGCFAYGYSLLVPKLHLTSLAAADQETLSALTDQAAKMREALEALFGQVVVAEHGSGAPDEPTAACCVHAHLHFIPVKAAGNSVLLNYQECGGPGERISGIAALRGLGLEGASYLTLSPEAGIWYLWRDASRFPRQFVRRAAADAIGQPMVFDWRASPFEKKMVDTTNLVRHFFDRNLLRKSA